MSDTAELATPEPASTRLVAVTVDDPVLGGPVRLELGKRWTVLVGKNGAGKSRLLEDLLGASLAAIQLSQTSRPARVTIEVELAGEALLYKYVCARAMSTPPDEGMVWYWKEVATAVGSNNELWHVSDGTARFGHASQPLPPFFGLLHLRDSATMQLPPQTGPLRALLRGVRLVRAGVPRHATSRETVRLQTPEPAAGLPGARWTGRGDERLIDVVTRIVSWFEANPERFDRVVEVGRRLQVLQTLEVRIEDLEVHTGHPPAKEAELFVDGVNFGYLSDGTQRLVEMVVRIVDPTVHVLLLEEPETSVHPGLLRRLLAELDGLGTDRQVVISTHAPLVVDAAAPHDVRLVERSSTGATTVRSLTPDEHSRLGVYLDDGLELSDFVYSGAMD